MKKLHLSGVEHVYGIPQHADTFSLKDTSGTDPYRLYNLDVFEYELWNPMALYAAIPFMMGHGGSGTTTGLFWLNAAEGWIDIKKESMGHTSEMNGFLYLFLHYFRGGVADPDSVFQFSKFTYLLD
jgi:alpha 1,3-glucosidase